MCAVLHRQFPQGFKLYKSAASASFRHPGASWKCLIPQFRLSICLCHPHHFRY
jgi:hypothetical protein